MKISPLGEGRKPNERFVKNEEKMNQWDQGNGPVESASGNERVPQKVKEPMETKKKRDHHGRVGPRRPRKQGSLIACMGQTSLPGG